MGLQHRNTRAGIYKVYDRRGTGSQNQIKLERDQDDRCLEGV